MDVTRIMNRAKDAAGVKARDGPVETKAERVEEPEESPTRFKGPKGVKWIVFRSSVLDDRFVLVYDKRDLKEAMQAHPDKAIYFPPEIEDLLDKAEVDVEGAKVIHEVKKFGGWIIPPGTPEYEKQTKGGCNHGKVERGRKARK